MGVQTPEYMALIGRPIETLDQWSQGAIIGVGIDKTLSYIRMLLTLEYEIEFSVQSHGRSFHPVIKQS